MLQLTSHTTIYDQLKSQRNTDVKFICSDGQICAHLVMLAANCKWFQDNEVSSIALLEFTIKTVFEFLELVYIGSKHVEDNIPIKKLVDLFQCSIQEKEVNTVNNVPVPVHQNEAASPSTPSGSAAFLLPNPFAKILHSSPLLNRINDLNNINVSNPSPSIIPPTEESIKNLRNSPEKLRTNSQSSDSSDILIIEDPPPPLVEVNDTATQQLLEPLSHIQDKDNNEGKIKCDYISPVDVVNPMETGVMTSDDTDIDVENVELPPSKRTKSENTCTQERVPQQSPRDSPDDTKRMRMIRPRNGYRFDSTDEESEREEIQRRTIRKKITRSSKNTASSSNHKHETAENNNMQLKFKDEPVEKLMSVCFVCEEYYPNIDTHITARHTHHKSPPAKCPHCSKKFCFKIFLDIHLKNCHNSQR